MAELTVIGAGAGFADTPAGQALARRFRVIGVDPGLLAEAAAALESVGFMGVGSDAGAVLAAAAAAGERAKAVVLVSPQGLLGAAAPEGYRVPTAVLIGSRDTGQPRDALSSYRRVLPRCNPVLVYDAGADIAADRPKAFADAAGDFLDRQGRFAFMTESVALVG